MATFEDAVLCIEDYDVFGFDMDCCLAKYYLDTLVELGYKSLTQFLVDKKGYDARLLEPPIKYKDLGSRGLILDKTKGNLIKLGCDGYILRCSHGSRQLCRKEINDIYGSVWDRYDELFNRVDHFAERYWLLESFFDLPQGIVFARMVDLHDEKKGGKAEEEYNLWPDLYLAMGSYYSLKQGPELRVFNEVPTNPGKYVRPCSESVRSWLLKLKKTGKTVFLMTSSPVDFTRSLLTFILGSNIDDYFDFYLCSTHKPKFYYKNKPFRKEGENEGRMFQEFDAHGWYSDGNMINLQDILKKMANKENPKVLYAGDGLKNDAFPSKHYAKWDSLLVLENTLLDEALSGNLPKEVGDNLAPPPVDLEYNGRAVWGPFLTDEFNGKKVKTFFAKVVETYADLAVPLLDFLAELPLDHKFKRFSKIDPLGGYYPFTTTQLKEAS